MSKNVLLKTMSLGALLMGCASLEERREQAMLERLERQQALILRRMEIDREAKGDGYAENERLRQELAFEKEQARLRDAARAAGDASQAFMNMMNIGRYPRQ